MTEIKIQQSPTEVAFNELKSKTGELNTAKPAVNFNESNLEFLQQLENIETAYYQMIHQYKGLLLKAEDAAATSIADFIEFEQSLGSNIMK
ncbi:YwqI/YxiC family protein [Bacillus sp. CRN 9]|nr:YwqI/YxiC family protein [Bacillus sp. CRN 9]